jgi:hypothetical protein
MRTLSTVAAASPEAPMTLDKVLTEISPVPNGSTALSALL